MCIIPLRAKVTNVNEDTLVLASNDVQQSLNSLYEAPKTNHVLDHVQSIMTSNRPSEFIHNVYKFLSIEPVICYLHSAAGFPTKATWLKAIHILNYLSWPLVIVKNLTKHFPNSKETQQGHMKGQR